MAGYGRRLARHDLFTLEKKEGQGWVHEAEVEGAWNAGPSLSPSACHPSAVTKVCKISIFLLLQKMRTKALLFEGWETSCRGGRWIPFVCFLEQLYWAINHPFKTARSNVFYILADSCKHPNFRTLPLPQKNPLAVTPPHPSSSTCRQPQIYFPISTDLLFLDIKYKWNHTIFCE